MSEALKKSEPKPPALPGLPTPTDSPAPAEQAKAVPQRGRRKRVLGEGEGDYCIYEIVGTGHSTMPAGSLIPIPGVPRFEETKKALQWIATDSGDTLAGKQVMVFRACEILAIQVQAKPTIVIQAKAKKVVTDPTQDSAKPDTPSNG